MTKPPVRSVSRVAGTHLACCRPQLKAKKKKEKKKEVKAGEMAQWLKALAALSDILSSFPSNRMVFETATVYLHIINK